MADYVAGQILHADDLNGEVTPGDWQPLDLGALWDDYGSGYNPAAYRVHGSAVSLRGLVKSTAPVDDDDKRIVATLPVDVCPPAKELVVAWGFQTIDGAIRIDVEPTGAVRVMRVSDGMDVDGTFAFLSLDGIRFWTA